MSAEFLSKVAEGETTRSAFVDVSEDGQFALALS